MTTLTEQPEAISPPIEGRARLPRFAAAFAFGLLAALAIVVGAAAAFDASYAGRILPGVHVGGVDVSGLTRDQAEGRLAASFASLGDGELVLSAGGKTTSVAFGDLGRRLDIDGMVDRALAAGRSGGTFGRIASEVRTAALGVTIAPDATVDAAALEAAVATFVGTVDAPPVNAAVTVGPDGFVLTDGTSGRTADQAAALSATTTALTAIDAPQRVEIEIPVVDTQPAVSTEAARQARYAAVRIASDIVLVDGEESWTIAGDTIRGWITFAVGADGSYWPVVARDGLTAALADVAKKVARAPVNASYLLGQGSQVVGVSEGQDGRALDVPSTLAAVEEIIHARAAGSRVTHLGIVATRVEPELTTAEAVQSAPLMQPISEWTTYFPIGIANGFGANIWIPAKDIDGQVVMPGKWFDFWKGIGPISREHGYTDGGAIINGKTEPQGALAGGICSCSTTLFNAALRAGLEMGARRNHYYYIGRYPLGLDATVFASGSGSVQTMSWKNDTTSPILIRSYRWAVGSKGYVKFVLWSVPTGRTIKILDPIVKNVLKASDTIVYTTRLKPGVRERVTVPVDGMDVWRTRIVYDAAGKIIHQETYYSHYSRITGILEVGASAPAPTPTDPPSTPSPTTP